MTAVDTVLFDLDDTLCTYRRTPADHLDEAFAETGVEPFFTAEGYLDRYREFAGDATTVDELRATAFAAFAEEEGHDPSVGRRVADAFSAARDHREVDPLPGVRETLDVLHERDHRVGVVTNGPPGMQGEKLDALGLADTFEVVVHAGWEGVPAKPEPDPFHRALDSLGAAPGRTVHVGDSLASDVAGAQAAGLDAAWLRQHDDAPAPTPEYTLDSLHDLAALPWE
jgi:putative hydrolase of the HAD superfamily